MWENLMIVKWINRLNLKTTLNFPWHQICYFFSFFFLTDRSTCCGLKILKLVVSEMIVGMFGKRLMPHLFFIAGFGNTLWDHSFYNKNLEAFRFNFLIYFWSFYCDGFHFITLKKYIDMVSLESFIFGKGLN